MKEDHKTLVLFGDSLLGRFSSGLVRKLSQHSGYNVYNCATGGLNTIDGANQASFIARLNPDYVVLSFGSNDAAPWKQQVGKEMFKEKLSFIIEAFIRSKIIILLCPLASENVENGKFKEFNKVLPEYNQVIKEIAAEHLIEVIDSDKLYSEIYSGKDDYHKEDGIHLNADGYEVLINEISSIVNKSNQS